MSNQPTNPDRGSPPVVIAEFPHEFTATLAKQALEVAGIPCQITGIHTAGFRAEAPGMVRVLVPSSREAEARAIMEDFHSQPDELDPEDPDAGWADEGPA